MAAENFALPSQGKNNNYIIEKIVIIFHNITVFYCIYVQISAALVKVFFLKHLKNLTNPKRLQYIILI